MEKIVSPLEQTFYMTLPLRQFLEEHLDAECFVRLLCCSWTLYASHRRVGSQLSKQLRLSPLFIDKRLLRASISVQEFCSYLWMLYDNITHNGSFFTLVPPRLVVVAGKKVSTAYYSIYLHATGSSTLKMYSNGLHYPCDEQHQSENSIVDTVATAGHKGIDSLVHWLKHYGVFCQHDNVMIYRNKSLYAFVFRQRYTMLCNEIHQQYLCSNKIDMTDLLRQFRARQH